MPDKDAAAEERAALEQSARGMAVRRQVLGDEHVDRAIAAADAFTAPFQDLITRYAWGEVWTRPGLTRPERNGLSPEQIREVLLQVAIYAGVPAANRAFTIAQRVLAGAAPAGPTDEAG